MFMLSPLEIDVQIECLGSRAALQNQDTHTIWLPWRAWKESTSPILCQEQGAATGISIRAMTSDESLDRLARAVRSVQDALPNSTVSDDAANEAAAALERAGAVLAPFTFTATPSSDWTVLGMNRGVRSIGPLIDAQWEEMQVTGKVIFTNFFHGANGAAHGGTIPLMFDEIFGRMSTSDGVLRRAANLKVDFRSVTPLNTELSVEAHLQRTEGRKSWLVGILRHGDTITAEAESLWITVRPGGL